MSIRYLTFLLVIAFFLSGIVLSCKPPQSPAVKSATTKSDSLWLEFASAMERRDIRYLKKRSLDTIQCAECTCGCDKPATEVYKAETVFAYCLEQLMHLKTLSDKDFSTSGYGSNEIQVIYSIDAPKAEEGAYSLIFFFEKTNKGYLFKGMILT